MKRTICIIVALGLALTLVLGSVSTVSAKGKPVKSFDVFFADYNSGNLEFSVNWDNIRASGISYALYRGGDNTTALETGFIYANPLTTRATSYYSGIHETKNFYQPGAYRIDAVLRDAKYQPLEYADSDEYTFTLTTLFEEDFTDVSYGSLPAGWTTTSFDLGRVELANDAGGSMPELEIYYCESNATGYADYRVSTPSINATGITDTLSLSFRHYFSVTGSSTPGYNYTIAVELSTDGGTTWSPTSLTYDTPPSNIGPVTAKVDLSEYIGQVIRISWHVYGITYHMNCWSIDDVVVTWCG